MSHLLEEYAKNLGVKISTPIVTDHFFPLVMDKYITISNNDEVPSKSYPYYHLVIKLLRPFLDRAKIKVIQLGGKKRIEGVDQALNLSFKQNSFVISKSLVHLGSDGSLNQLASAKKVPTVTLFGNTFPAVNGPLFSSPSLTVNLAPEWNKKPCFGNEDSKKQILSITPESIAQNVLDFLNIEKEDVNFLTKHIGKAFLESVVEVIPTSYTPLRIPENQILYIRADYGYKDDAFLQYCKSHKCSVLSSQLIQPHGLKQIAENLDALFIFMDRTWDDIPSQYFKTLKKLGINCVILTEKEEDVSLLRNKYFDIAVRLYKSEEKAPSEITENTRFLSGKRLIEGGKEYLSYAHWKKGLDNNNTVIDSPDYWKELEHFYIYEQHQDS